MANNMSTSQAARYLNISKSRVLDLIHDGVLDAERIGSVWAIDEMSVELRKNSVSKKGGRPPIGKGKFETNYTLYNRQYPVLELVYDDKEHRFKKADKILDVKRCPFWTFDKHGIVSLSSLNVWWRNRGIPNQRDNIQEILENEGVQVPEELIERNLGLSLSDQYWLKPKASSLKWEDINFFNHDFENSELDGEEKKFLELGHPSNTSDGNLEKYWTIENGEQTLIKAGGTYGQEPFGEVVATKLFEILLEKEDYVAYTCEKINGKYVSKCTNFLSDKEEYVPAWYILQSMKKPNHLSEYQHFINLSLELGVSDIEQFVWQMLVCDFVILNHDRHYRNFGLVRNVEDLTWHPAPIFDSGSSLLCDVDNYDLKHHLWKYETKPFYKKPNRQLLLIEDTSWLDDSKLSGFEKIIPEVFKADDKLLDRAEFIQDAVKRQIEIISLL